MVLQTTYKSQKKNNDLIKFPEPTDCRDEHKASKGFPSLRSKPNSITSINGLGKNTLTSDIQPEYYISSRGRRSKSMSAQDMFTWPRGRVFLQQHTKCPYSYCLPLFHTIHSRPWALHKNSSSRWPESTTKLVVRDAGGRGRALIGTFLPPLLFWDRVSL